jgi:hypothetical protein
VQESPQRVEIRSQTAVEGFGPNRHAQEFRCHEPPFLDGVIDQPAHRRKQAEVEHHDFARGSYQDVAWTEAQVEKRRLARVSGREHLRDMPADHADHSWGQPRAAGSGSLLSRLQQPDKVNPSYPARRDESPCPLLADLDHAACLRGRSCEQPPTRRKKP